ncbi:MAG: DUF4034 domain-containing protein [Proteobacteria bacterium]|nr:DUF4034 domain-containing protein [Pseudomonadota bacterium]
MKVYCKTCQKVLGTIADEKIPPNIKKYITCKTCNEKILLFRKVETSAAVEGAEGSKKRQEAVAKTLTGKVESLSIPSSSSDVQKGSASISHAPRTTKRPNNNSIGFPFPPKKDDKGIKKADLLAVMLMGGVVLLLVAFAKPEFNLSKFLPAGTEYEVTKAASNLPVSREAKETITVARVVQLREMLRKRQFEQLNTALEKYQKSFEADQTNEYKVFDAYGAFRLTNPSYEGYMEEWVKRYPDSYQPRLAIAQYYYTKGWESRGHKFIKDTSEDQIEEMNSYFVKVEENINNALEINPNLMPAYRILIGISNTSSIAGDENEIINKVLELFPHSYIAASNSTWAKEPRWGGNYAVMENIAKGAERYSDVNPKLTALYGQIYYDQGRILFGKEKYKEAVDKLTKAITFGDDSSFYKMRARIYHYHLKDYSLALEDISRAIELRPVMDEYYLLRAKIYFTTGNYYDSLEDLHAAELIKPDDPKISEWKEWVSKALVYQGHQLYKESDYNGSVEMFGLAIDSNDKNFEAYYWRGMAFTYLADIDSAFSDFEKAIDVNPSHFESYRMIDYILAKDKQWESIIGYWDSFIAVEPDNAEAYLERAGTYYHNRDLINASSDLEKSCELGNKEACSRYQGLKSKV